MRLSGVLHVTRMSACSCYLRAWREVDRLIRLWRSCEVVSARRKNYKARNENLELYAEPANVKLESESSMHSNEPHNRDLLTQSISETIENISNVYLRHVPVLLFSLDKIYSLFLFIVYRLSVRVFQTNLYKHRLSLYNRV